MKIKWIVAAAAVALAASLTHRTLQDADRSKSLQDALARASRLEAERRYSEAIMVYDVAQQSELADADRAILRYRLANALIQGNDLNRALDVLQTLTEEDVATHRIDVTGLYLQLGDSYMEAGQRGLAKVAYRLGQGIAMSGPRVTEFAERMEQFITPIEQPDG